MRKNTEPQTPKHPTTSRAGASKKGLIAKNENAPRSVGETYVLDDRSHRTDKLQARGAAREQDNCADARPHVACKPGLGALTAAMADEYHWSLGLGSIKAGEELLHSGRRDCSAPSKSMSRNRVPSLPRESLRTCERSLRQ